MQRLPDSEDKSGQSQKAGSLTPFMLTFSEKQKRPNRLICAWIRRRSEGKGKASEFEIFHPFYLFQRAGL